MVTIYDEATREILVSAAGSTGLYRATGYSLTQNQWTNWSSPWNVYSGIADVRVGRRVVIVQPGYVAAGGYGAQPTRYWDYNLDSRTVTASSAVQYGAGLSASDFPPANWFYDSSALTYLPTKNRFWFYTLMANGKMELIELDPTTTPWTARRPSGNVASLTNIGLQLERKMFYLPALNAVLMCNKADQNLLLYKL